MLLGAFTYSLHTRLVNVERRFGGIEKLKCNEEDVRKLMQESVVRVIGAYGEGSGFPISEKEILTNFHVIDGEPTPKVVFSDGTFETVKRIRGSKKKDVAILEVERALTPLSFYGFYGNALLSADPTFGEPIYTAGFPLGSDLVGDVTVKKGSYGGKRYLKELDMTVVQTEISLNGGMSGGPLVNSCGQVLGVNLSGLSGLSLFLDMVSVQNSFGDYTTDDVAKITIDLSSPEGTVEAFYTHIRARDLKNAYELISSERKATIQSFEQWTEGYNQTLHVELLSAIPDEEDENLIFVKLVSQDWVNGELVFKYFEGTWQVVKEDSLYKLNQSNIKEIAEPSWEWFR